MNDVDERVTGVAGRPNERVTHWGASKLEHGEFVRQGYPNGDGVVAKYWPIEDLNLENLRERFKSGEIKLHWFSFHPDEAIATKRFKNEGNGAAFVLEAPPKAADPPPAMMPTPPAGAEGMGAALSFATTLMQMSDQRAESTLRAVATMAGARAGGPLTADTDTASRIAKLEATIEADRLRREQEDRHRAELAERDRRIADLERDDGGPEAPMFEPGAGSFWEQLGYGAMNAIAKMKPETIEKVTTAIAPFIERAATGQAAAPPPPQAPPRQIVRHAPPPPPAPEVPITSLMPSQPMARTTSNGIPVISATPPAMPVDAPPSTPPA